MKMKAYMTRPVLAIVAAVWLAAAAVGQPPAGSDAERA
jgi:hypothetical protein